MSKLLSNLEYLELIRITDEPAFEGEAIHLEGLKIFQTQYPNMLTTPIIFGSLEEITCYGPSISCFDMIIQNRNMKKN